MHVLSIPYEMNRKQSLFALDFNEGRSDSPLRVRSIVCQMNLQGGEINKSKTISSFKSNENIHKNADGSYYIASANKVSSVHISDPVMARQRKPVETY